MGISDLDHVPPQRDNMSTALDALTFDMKGLIRKIQDLRSLGIEDRNIALPKICVVGDQSTGKSSLIEAISEIKVPRSEGACTRCPLQINISQSEPQQPWKCVVFLSRPYTWDPHGNLRRGTKKNETIGHWIYQGTPDDERFCVLTERSEIPEAIKWAQVAILNPGLESQQFVPGKNIVAVHEHKKNQEEFSPNIVRLDISGPDLPTLSFYDLPGVIRQAKNAQESYLVGLIEDLVKRHAADQSCIVLLTRSMTGDAEVSSSGGIIQKIKGAEARTIGVLTKPDRVANDVASEWHSFNQWIEILEGKTFALGHGYYVVKNNPDPQVSHIQARHEEMLFFSSGFWGSHSMSNFRNHLGVKNLQNALSNVLMDQIQKSLPSIIIQVKEKAKRINGQLKDLPETPSEDSQRMVTEMLTILYQRLKSLLEGNDAPFSEQEFANLTRDFKTALLMSMPKMSLQTPGESTDNVKKESEASFTPPKRKATNMEEGSPPKIATKVVPASSASEFSFPAFEAWKAPADRYSLGRLREIRGRFQRAGAPNQTDPRAVDTLNRMSVKHWHQPLGTFVWEVHKMARTVLLQTLESVMGQYRQTELFRELTRIIEGFLSGLHKEYMICCIERYKAEVDKPFTLAEELHKRYMEDMLRLLTDCRSEIRVKDIMKADKPTEDKKAKKIELGPDGYSPEVEMMAVSTSQAISWSLLTLTELPCLLHGCKLPLC